MNRLANQRRQPKPELPATAMDAVAIALSPALIICMIACLIFFLVVAFYQGEYDIRLMYILGLYTMATVLIARIAIESGRAYANAFSLPLAVVTLLAMLRFVTVAGPLGPISWLVNIGLLALAWYLADRITFDCTLVDDRDKSIQQGLLQTLGLLKRDPVIATRTHASQAEGVPAKGKKKKHNPGVWVLYFSLLAFPLFGLGQLVIPDPEQRQSAFWFLVGYLASALCLLLTTSLVGLRRYLRQRGVAMPAEMTRAWLGLGMAGVLAILVACMLLPLPGRSLGLVGLPIGFESPASLNTSRFGWGKEGSQNPSDADSARAQTEAGPPGGPPKENGKGNPQASDNASDKSPKAPASDSSSSTRPQSSSPSGQQQPTSGQQQPTDGKPKSTSGQQQPADSKQKPTSGQQQPASGQQQSASGQQQSAQEQANGNRAADDRSDAQESNDASTPEKADAANQPNRVAQPTEEPNGNSTASDEPDPQDQHAQEAAAEQPTGQPDVRSSLPRLDFLSGSLSNLIKWLTIVVLAAIVLLYAVTHPREIAKLWRDLMAMLASLFGARRNAESTSDEMPTAARIASPQSRRSFSSFANPFASQLQGWTPPQVIEHSFAALEAWAAEHGAVRHEDQTAAEFARQLTHTSPNVGTHAQAAANMLDRLMFAGWKPSSNELAPLAKLWQALRQN